MQSWCSHSSSENSSDYQMLLQQIKITDPSKRLLQQSYHIMYKDYSKFLPQATAEEEAKQSSGPRTRALQSQPQQQISIPKLVPSVIEIGKGTTDTNDDDDRNETIKLHLKLYNHHLEYKQRS